MAGKLVRGYDRLAPWYQAIEWLRFGHGLQTSREALLDQIPPCKEALFVGDGDGRLLQAFVARQPRCHVTSVEISRRMLDYQRKRLANNGSSRSHYRLIQADIRQYDLSPQQFDLIVTAYHLDCFMPLDLEQLIARLTPALREKGCWYVVDFAIPQHGFKRYWAQIWSSLMIVLFRWQTGLSTRSIADIRQLFFDRGWTPIAEQVSRSEFQFSILLQRSA